MKKLIYLIILALILGCTHTYEVTKSSQTTNAKLDKNAKAYVSVPEDGRYGDILYEGSGYTTALAIQKAFAKHLSIVDWPIPPVPSLYCSTCTTTAISSKSRS